VTSARRLSWHMSSNIPPSRPAVINTHTQLGYEPRKLACLFVLGLAVINTHTLAHTAYVVDCAPVSPCTYSSSTHRFPDERKPIEATPLSATFAELGLGVGLGLGLDSLAHFSSHTLPFFSLPSFHTLFLFPEFTSVSWSDQSTQASARRIS